MDGALASRATRGRRYWRDGPRIPSSILLAIVALTMLGAVALIFTTVQAERRARAQVLATGDVLGALGSIGRAAINGETGQRGYLLTSDRRYLEPYLFGRSRHGPAMNRLKRLIEAEATAEQRALVEEVERLADAKWAEMAETVALVERGDRIGAEVALLSDEGQLTMVRLRRAIAELETIERAMLQQAVGRASTAEARVLPLLGLLLAMMIIALALGLWQVARTARAEAAAAQARALAEARDRADLLARELNHRVKNLFAVILAIVRMTGKGDPAAKPVVDRISQRIHALVTAHEVTQGALERPVVDLRELVETAIAPYCSDSERCMIDGDHENLSARMAVPLGLVLHEIVTNAVKYGAWAQPGGTVEVRWRRVDGRVHLTWRERGQPLPQAARNEGFGSTLIHSAARQLGGTIERLFHADGIEVVMEFPAE